MKYPFGWEEGRPGFSGVIDTLVAHHEGHPGEGGGGGGAPFDKPLIGAHPVFPWACGQHEAEIEI